MVEAEGIGFSARVVKGFLERLKGLLGTRSDASPILLVPCRSIHTFGMRYPMDICFLDASGGVVRSIRRVGAGAFLKADEARSVLERPSSAEPWPVEGSKLRLTFVCGSGERAHDSRKARMNDASQVSECSRASCGRSKSLSRRNADRF